MYTRKKYLARSTLVMLGALMLPVAVMAGVNLKNGNFFISYQDVTLRDGGRELALKRTYNSLATFSGWFGFGWGSRFETRLVALPDNSVAVQEIGSGSIFYYDTVAKDGKAPAVNVAQGIEQIVSRATQRDQLDADAAADLRRRLAANQELRMRKTLEYAVPVELPVGAVLRSSDCARSAVTRLPDGYKRADCQGGNDWFDLQGRLLRTEAADGYQIRADYAGNRPQTITDSSGNSLRLEWTAEGRVAAQQGGQHRVLYTYDATGNLIRNYEADGYDYHYLYDGNHNLTRIGYMDTSSMQISYESPESGRATEVIERNDDKTRYEYGTDPADANHYWTRVDYLFNDGRRDSRRYEYRIQQTDNGAEHVASIVADNRQRRQENRYDDKGRIVRRINADGDYTELVYHPVSGKVILVFENKRSTVFHYDDAGKLLRAENSQGVVIELSYDSKDNISRMVETDPQQGTRRTLEFRYNAAGKPVTITLAGVGKIDVSYDDKGEVREAVSKQGAAMAMQVTQVFQSLLSVVKVANVRLSF